MRMVYFFYVVPAATLLCWLFINPIRLDFGNILTIIFFMVFTFFPGMNWLFIAYCIFKDPPIIKLAYIAGFWTGAGIFVFLCTSLVGSIQRHIAARKRQAFYKHKSRADSARREQERREEIKRYLASITSKALSIPEHARRAKLALEVAKKEFADGYLDPFWDAIETATTELALVNASTHELNLLLKAITAELMPDVSDSECAASLSAAVMRLPTTGHLYDELRATVRQSQKNADYSKIFHLRRTNRILVSGFTTLGHAINDMGQHIAASVESVTDGIRDLHETQSKFASEVFRELQASRDRSEKLIGDRSDQVDHARGEFIKERRAVEARKIDMIDNIQRGLRPAFPVNKPGVL